MRVAKAKGKLSKRQIKFATIFVILAVIAGGIVFTIKTMSAPAVGSLNQAPPKKDEIVDPYKEPGSYNGKLISFTYPDHFKQQKQKLTGSFLETANFISTNHSNKQISVGVIKEEFTDESGINYRRAHPELYIEEPKTRNSVSFRSKAGDSERTVYIQQGEYIVSVSVTAPAGTAVSDDCQVVVSSLRWKP